MTGGFRSRSSKGDRPKNTTGRPGRPVQKRGGKPHAQQSQKPQKIQRTRSNDVDAPRLAAYDVVHRVCTEDAYANLILPKELTARHIEGRDAAFATEITYGTLRTLGVLDAVIAECSSRPLDQIAPPVLDALRLGAYQVLYTRVEPHAAVDTTVRLVEATGNVKAKGFTNAVMRQITRTPAQEWMTRLAPEGDVAKAAFTTAHPAWIAESFARALGQAAGELNAALEADSERPRVHLVARPGEMTAEELALIIGGEEGKYSPYAVYMDGGDPRQLEPVREHLAAVQDEGSQLLARAVTEAPLEGDDHGRWLDLCAGPGGKAALVGAIASIDGATLDAVEVSAHRAKLVSQATDGLPVKVHVADGTKPELDAGYDRVLVDAPCSGLGALRRRPEARWRKQESDIAELNTLQFELLSSAYSLVRPGGVVVYSTCSPDLRETRGVVDRAVSELGAEELDAHPLVAPMDNVGEEKSIQMWPHRHGTDAMFMAVLRKPA